MPEESSRSRSASKTRGRRTQGSGKKKMYSKKRSVSSTRSKAVVQKLIAGEPVHIVLNTALGADRSSKMLLGRDLKTGQYTAAGRDANPCKKELDALLQRVSNGPLEASKCLKAVDKLKRCVMGYPAYFGPDA